MDAQQGAALRTRPPHLLPGDKGVKANLLNLEEVLHHAHAVLGAVSLVELTQSNTGKARAIGAELPASCLASLDLAGNACLALSAVIASAARAAIPGLQKGAAEAAIHATRGDKSDRV